MKRSKLPPLLGRSLMGIVTLGVTLLLIGMVHLLADRFESHHPPPPLPPDRATSNDIATDPAPLIIRRPPSSPQPSLPLPTAMTYEEMFQAAASAYDLDWHLLAELAYQESRMNPWAIGRDNDMGMMQIIPATWNEFAPQVGVTDPFDPYSNIRVGAAYLAYMRDFTHSRGYTEDVWMVVGYNWGPENLEALFAGQGTWAQVPARQRNYAIAIVEATHKKLARWQQ